MILFVDQSGQVGGAELCLADLAAGTNSKVLLFSDGPFVQLLKERGIAVDVLSLSSSASRITKSASPLKLVSTIPSLLSHVLALSRQFKQADVVYLNTAKALIYGAGANLLVRKPSVYHLHDLLDPLHFSTTNIKLLVGAANRMDAVIANSQATADTFRAVGGRAPVHVIYNGFDPAIFDQVSLDKISSLRRDLNPANRPVVAIFGRLTRWKGQHILLQAARGLQNIELWLVGEALFTDDDRAYAGELRADAAKLGTHVHLLGFRDDVPALMRAADIVVHCSTAPEPFGRVLAEAMLCRKPVVATAAGGPKEIVEEGITGFLTPPGDPASLATAIRKLTDSEPLRQKMGEAGRARAEQLFSLSLVRKNTDSVLRTLVK